MKFNKDLGSLEQFMGCFEILVHLSGGALRWTWPCVWLDSYLLRWGHKVDGSVVIIIFLDETESELVVDQEIVYLEN